MSEKLKQLEELGLSICLDKRKANHAILREKHIQEISETKVFSKLDLNMALYKIELHPDSCDITTFAALDCLYWHILANLFCSVRSTWE